MKKQPTNFFAILILLSLIASGSVPVKALEGLWEPEAIPPQIKKRFNLSDTDINRIRQSTLRTENGGTGVFVSPNGLVLTNQHVAKDFIQKISNSRQNYIRDGYLAADSGGELKLPETKLSVLEFQKDVTQTINNEIKPGMPPGLVRTIQIDQSRKLADQTQSETGLNCEVLSTFNGSKHTLYAYKTYSDVRLVYVPEQSVAVFGGDEDNFSYPRYWLDIAFLRIYENDRPLQNKSFLSFSREGITQEKDAIVAGFPISTERNLAAAHLRFLQNTELPLIINRIETELASLRAYAQLGREQETEVQSQIFELENSLKAIKGRLEEMKKNNLATKAAGREKEITDRLKKNSETPNSVAPFTELEKLFSDRTTYEAERRILDEGWGLDTVFFRAAREHVRWANQKSLPETERLPGFNNTLLDRLENIMRTNAPTREPHEGAKLENSLKMMIHVLGPDHPAVNKVLGNKSPKERAAELLTTRLDDQQFRIGLIEQGKDGLTGTTDPLIVLMRWVEDRALELRALYQNDFVSNETVSYPKVIDILRNSGLKKSYPDANFSLRFSFGEVKGYTENNKKIVPFTYFSGFLKRAAYKKYLGNFNIPDKWKKMDDPKTSETPFNFVLTNDVAGGNSGSPVINNRGELIGLIFDSNMPSLVWKYEYDESAGRAIAVDIRAIKLALEFSGAENVLSEIFRTDL